MIFNSVLESNFVVLAWICVAQNGPNVTMNSFVFFGQTRLFLNFFQFSTEIGILSFNLFSKLRDLKNVPKNIPLKIGLKMRIFTLKIVFMQILSRKKIFFLKIGAKMPNFYGKTICFKPILFSTNIFENIRNFLRYSKNHTDTYGSLPRTMTIPTSPLFSGPTFRSNVLVSHVFVENTLTV